MTDDLGFDKGKIRTEFITSECSCTKKDKSVCCRPTLYQSYDKRFYIGTCGHCKKLIQKQVDPKK